MVEQMYPQQLMNLAQREGLSARDLHIILSASPELWANQFAKIRGEPYSIWRRFYQLYLYSDAWRQKREQVFYSNGRYCQRCGARENLHIHHLRYDRVGDEPLDALMVLCKDCHAKEHT